MFDHETIIEALLKSEKISTGGATGKYLTQEGWQEGKPQSFKSGSFQGKAGTVARSNKGRTYRKPNGTRRYLIDYNTDVIAYTT